jgi:hypothetical protein
MSFYIFLSEIFWEIEVMNIFTIPIDGSAVRFHLIENSLKLGTIFTCLELPILSARGSNGSNKGRGGERGGGTAPLTGKQAHCASAVAVFSTGAAPPHSHTQVAVVPKLAEQTGRVPTAAILVKQTTAD